MEITKPVIEVLAKTELDFANVAKTMAGFKPDTGGGEGLAEAAGRACYQSFSRPNPATATNAGYIRHILEIGHLSVLEHGTVSMYFQGVSRSFTHELVRHRHFSYSQLSQRYVAAKNLQVVVPDIIAEDPKLLDAFNEAMENAEATYNYFLESLDDVLGDDESLTATNRKKRIRQAARSVLPNATETRIIVTGNYRSWRHFLHLRAKEDADVEIRAAAVTCLERLQAEAPNVFADWEISSLPDGTRVADTPFSVR